MIQEQQFISALEKLGVQVERKAPKRKDNLPGFLFRIPMKDNVVPKDIASILGGFIAEAGYSYTVTLNDNEYGSHQVDSIDGSEYLRNTDRGTATRIGKSPLIAIGAAMESVRTNLVSSLAQDRAIREEEETMIPLDMDRNATIFSEENSRFLFDLESVEVLYHPTNWAFRE